MSTESRPHSRGSVFLNPETKLLRWRQQSDNPQPGACLESWPSVEWPENSRRSSPFQAADLVGSERVARRYKNALCQVGNAVDGPFVPLE